LNKFAGIQATKRKNILQGDSELCNLQTKYSNSQLFHKTMNMKSLAFIFFVTIATMAAKAQTGDSLVLEKPNREGGKPLMNCLNERHTSRNFIDKDLTLTQLTNLLWAAYGVNRADEGKRTAPSAFNKQEVDVYILTKIGAYRYDAFNNKLIEVVKGDIRSIAGVQDFVGVAAANLVYVLNKEKSGGKTDEEKVLFGTICTGAIVQNVYLFCASEGLGCVSRASFDRDKLSNSIKLGSDQKIILTQTVGYTK
jgi:nitroreductase